MLHTFILLAGAAPSNKDAKPAVAEEKQTEKVKLTGIQSRDQEEEIASYPGGKVLRKDLVTFLKLMPNLETEGKEESVVNDMEAHMAALKAVMKDFKDYAIKEGLKEKYADELEAINDQFLFRKALAIKAEKLMESDTSAFQKEVNEFKKEIESQKFYDLSLIICDNESDANSTLAKLVKGKDKKAGGKPITFEQYYDLQTETGDPIKDTLKRQAGRLSTSEPMPAKMLEIILGPENIVNIRKYAAGVTIDKVLKFRDKYYIVRVNSVHEGSKRAEAEVNKVKPMIKVKIQQQLEGTVLENRMREAEFKIKDAKSKTLKALKEFPQIVTRIKNMLTGRMGGMGNIPGAPGQAAE